MNYLIAHANPQNEWLSTKVNFYKKVGDYTSLAQSTQLLELSGSHDPILLDFQNVITYFITEGAGEWKVKTIKCIQDGSYNITHEEPYEEEITYEDENGNTITETVSGVRTVIDDIIPILNMRITNTSTSINNSERFYFQKTTDLTSEVESSVIAIWKHFNK